MPVAPIYLLDPNNVAWQLSITDDAIPTFIQQPSPPPSTVTAIFVEDSTISQLWRLTIVLDSNNFPEINIAGVAGSSTQTQILVNSPNGSLFAILFSNGVMQTNIGTTCAYSFLTLRQQLAQRLNDPTMTFWTDGELKVQIWNALRFWNALTGDNKVRYSLNATPGTVWYDLQQLAGSPRLVTLTDQDVYSWLQYALLEAQATNAAVGSGQYSTDDFVQAVQRKRDEFLFKSGCTGTILSLPVSPNSPTISVPAKAIQTLRGYWIPKLAGADAYALMKGDPWVNAAYVEDLTPSDPETFSAGMEVPGQITITPPPDAPGNVELLLIESQALLIATVPTSMILPSDFVPALLWGALSDLLGSGTEKQDQERAEYARKRYEQFVELLQHYPFVFSASADGVPIYVDAVEVLDFYEPNWRTTSANPSVVGLAAQNLVAFPTAAKMNVVLFLCANASLPTADGDCIVLGQEVIDAILDYAQHTASFKMGGADFQATMPLFEHIVKLAAQRNAKIAAMSTFRDVLYGRVNREEQENPKEKSPDTE